MAMTDRQREVKRFILLIKGIAPCMMGHIFTQGGCYRFYLILKKAFPDAKAFWNNDRDHVVTKISGVYWDIYGDYDPLDISGPLNKDAHKTASLFHFDEMQFSLRSVRKYLDGENGG